MLSFPEAIRIITHHIQDIPYPEQPARLYDPIAYLLDLKGKKVRPALTLLACNLYREKVDEAIPMALAWEIYHNFTLMHDDVMDEADMRRGMPTVHKKWNENTAILSGDAMLILSFRYLNQVPEQHLKTLLDLFSTTTLEICDGQQYDMEFESRLDVSEEEYLKMIRLKTAVMLGGALQSGAIIADADPIDQQNLYDFGINLGLAFQIQDDWLDVYGDPAVFGKNIGGDILCGKKTYLLINALNSDDEVARQELLAWLERTEKEEKIQAVTAIYDRLHIGEKAVAKKEEFYRKALRALDAVSVPNEKKAILRELAEDLLNRKS